MHLQSKSTITSTATLQNALPNFTIKDYDTLQRFNKTLTDNEEARAQYVKKMFTQFFLWLIYCMICFSFIKIWVLHYFNYNKSAIVLLFIINSFSQFMYFIIIFFQTRLIEFRENADGEKHVRDVLAYMFDNEFSCKLSWSGQKSTIRVQEMKFVTLLIGMIVFIV